ncbi:hypothetical protein [Amycolatopsis sp. cg9]|uniref:hypothetical protein n=1 Tax=Amycolatopsis sp. cg9 TaxID=3238801 RepID=UPI003526B4C9
MKTLTKGRRMASARTLAGAALAGMLALSALALDVSTAAASPAPPSAGLDAGMPSDGLHPDAPVTAPDGTRIWGTREGAAPASVARAAMPNTIEIRVDGARVRSSVPNGPVVGLAYRGQTGGANCKVSSGGYTWGLVSVNGSYGWMRTDLFTIIYQSTGPWGSLPRC